MLGKLFKHEWKRLWKVPTFLLILLQIIALGAGLAFLGPVFESDIRGIRVLIGLIWVTYFIMVIGVTFGVYIYLAIQFYKSTYSDEGYLTHTLPVSPRQILISKISMIAIWECITFIGILLSFVIFGLTAYTCLGEDWADLGYLFKEFLRELQTAFGYEGEEWVPTILALFISAIVSIIYTGVWISASTAIGQLVKKHRIAASIAAACIISFILSSIQNILQEPRQLMYTDMVDFMMDGIWASILLYTIAVVVLFIISEYLLRHKLNLE